MESKRLPKLCDDKTCTGCLACVNACNIKALSVTTNDEGFYRPKLIADKCAMCGLCEKSCPILNSPLRNNAESLKVYAAWHLNEEIRKHSSSGGAFTAFADAVLNSDGVVFGAAWGNNMLVEHIEVDRREELAKLRLSKYAQSRVGDAMKKAKERLEQGREVLFVGTPCQIAGLKNYLRKDYDNLVTVDFVCHGVPSIKFLQSYLKWLEIKTGEAVYMDFRDKRKGWYDNLRVVRNVYGKEMVLRGKDDCYWVAFNNNNNNLQPACYQCVTQGFPRCSDITIADFWGIGQRVPFGHKDEIEKGVSLVVVNNAKGAKLLDKAKNDLFLEERSIKEAIGGNLTSVQACARPLSRDTIYQDLDNMSFDEFRVKYMSTSLKQKAVKLFREYLPYGFVKRIRMIKQK